MKALTGYLHSSPHESVEVCPVSFFVLENLMPGLIKNAKHMLLASLGHFGANKQTWLAGLNGPMREYSQQKKILMAVGRLDDAARSGTVSRTDKIDDRLCRIHPIDVRLVFHIVTLTDTGSMRHAQSRLTSRAQAQPSGGTLNGMMTIKFHKSISTGKTSGCCLQRFVRRIATHICAASSSPQKAQACTKHTSDRQSA